MPLPNIRILDRFLDDYLEIRQTDTWNSTFVAVKNTVTPVLSSLTSSITSFFSSPGNTSEFKDDASLRSGLAVSLKERFANATTIDHWINIILELGTQSRKAQDHRINHHQDSLFCETLNAMRSYIITEIGQEQVFIDYINQLLKDKNEKEELIFQAKSKSQIIKELENTRNQILYILADCNHERSIFNAVELNLFHQYQFPMPQEWHDLPHTHNLADNPKVNFHKPWCYQGNFYLIYHEKHIQPRMMERFDDFKERARKGGKLILKPANTVVTESSMMTPEDSKSTDVLTEVSNNNNNDKTNECRHRSTKGNK